MKKGISVLISAYNNDNYIEDCLDSVQNQTFFIDNKNYEILVGIDGCAKTLKKLREIKDKYDNLKIINYPENKGMYVTTNSLIQEAKYDKLITFGSDDNMKSDMIEKIILVSKRADIMRFKFTAYDGTMKNEINSLSGAFHAFGAIFIRKRVFDMCGGYVNTRFSGDLELFTRVRKFVRIGYIDDELFDYRYHSENLSNTVDRSERNKFDAIVKATSYTKENLKINPMLNVGEKI